MPLSPGAWAKLLDGRMLPLADHAADVAAVLDALLSRGWLESLARAAERAITPRERERLVALAFLHDISKTNRGFWLRQFEGSSLVGHTAQVLSLFGIDRLAPLACMLASMGDDLLLATLAHHGRPVAELPRRDTDWLWDAGDNYDPACELEALLNEARRRFPAAFEDAGEALPPRAVALFAGLLTLADWIGSDPARFPLDGVTGAARAGRSRDTALAAVDALGLGRSIDLTERAAATGFPRAFGIDAPREGQARAGEVGLGRLTILEAETGSGKTEAALWRFLRLFAAGEVDALHFALPTRTSAVQMQARAQKMLDRVFGEGTVGAVLAVPGYLKAGEAEGERVGLFDTLWPDEPRDRMEDARWAAEAPKRFLSARIAVGTVDQALMAGLKVRHAHLRAASLSRALLVVDELHTSDTYMTEVLAQVLANHLGARGHAMLLSATLGAAARMRLMAGRYAKPPAIEEAAAAPYPALHGSEAGTLPVATDGRRKTVALTLAPEIADPKAVAGRALEAARRGASVLVLRNTVGDAIETQAALEALPGADPFLFRVKGVTTLHHGRFAAEDRRLLDDEVEAIFGKVGEDQPPTVRRGRERRPCVLVGTQTLEISLDLDADLMITDLAPADVLLQRLGRLFRHLRERPPFRRGYLLYLLRNFQSRGAPPHILPRI